MGNMARVYEIKKGNNKPIKRDKIKQAVKNPISKMADTEKCQAK